MSTTPNVLSDAPDIGSGAPTPVTDPGALAGIVAQPAPPAPDPTIGPAPAWSGAPSGPPVGLSPDGGTYTTPGSSAAGSGPTGMPPVPVKGLAATLIAGALAGLAGSKGATTFGGGLAGGAAGYAEAKQRELVNSQNQQQLQFESVRAGDSHVLAFHQAQEADAATELHKANLDVLKMNVAAFNKAMGVPGPALTIEADNPTDMHAQATGGLQTLAAKNGGKIPGVVTVNSAASGSDPKHQIDVYSKPTPQQVTKNEPAYRKLVDTASIISTGSPTSDEQWNTGNFKMQTGNPATAGVAMLGAQREGQAQMVLAAQQQLYGVPQATGNAGKDAATAANLQQQLTSYQKRDDANPAVVNLLQTQLQTFNSASDNASQKIAAMEARAAGQKKAAQVAAEADTVKGRLDLQKTQQDIIDKKYSNADKAQKALFGDGVNPSTGEKLNLSNAADEMLIDQNTHQPIPTKMLATLKPTQQESNRADFAKSTLHTLDMLDQLKAAGKLPNGPVTGLTTKALTNAGMSSADAQEATSYIALAQSAATGAHVGGRFNVPIMEKMGQLLKLNMNDSQFSGATSALRNVMQPYATQGGRETVAQYKSEKIGNVQVLKDGTKLKITGVDQKGQFIGERVQ
jgi:hypothetical protein